MAPNPYEPTVADPTSAARSSKNGAWKSIAVGACWSIVWSFPITALLGLLFRFPVPFGTTEGGIGHVVPSLFALLFYGVLMGGFVVLGGVGAAVGLAAHVCVSEIRHRKHCVRWLTGLASGILLLVLATLDWIIGPW